MKKKFIKIIAMALATVCAVATLGACDGVFSTIDGWLDSVFGEAPAPDDTTSDMSGTDNEDSGLSDSGTSNDSTSSSDVAEKTPLTDPENVSDLIISGLTYTGASLGIGEELTLLRFCVNVKQSLVEHLEMDRSMRTGVIYAPLEAFDEVNVDNYTVMDWVSALSGKATIEYFLPTVGDNYITTDNLSWEKFGSEYVCIPFVETSGGIGASEYQYGAMSGTYREQAKSAAYIASAQLNANYEYVHLTDELKVIYKNIINGAVDYANGLSSETADNSMPELVLDFTVTMKVGETYTIKPVFKPNVKLDTMYIHSGNSIGVDSQTGKITAYSAGKETVMVVVAGQEYAISVSVTE